MRVRMLVLLMMAGTAMAQQTGGGGVPGTQGGGAPTGSAGGALTGSYPNPGLSPSVAIIPLPTTSQTIVQPAGTSLRLNNVLASPINNVVYVDGVNGAGIGVAQSAWSSSTAYPQCTAVSYSGGNYLGVAASTNVAPGTNNAIWYPVLNAATPTQLDCAFYTAASEVGGGAGAAMRLGPGTYLSNIGLVEPTVTVPGWPVVNIYGQGRAVTTVKLNTNNGDGFPFLYLPKTSVNYAFASFNWEGFTVDANYNSTGAVGIYGAQQYTLKDMIVADAADGSDHEIEFGDSTDTLHGWTFEPDIENVDLGTFRGFGTGAIISTTVSGGVPSFTVTAGGSGYSSADTKAVLAGTSDFGRPCSSMGTTTATIVSGAITAVTSTATGCVAPAYTIIYSGPDINYGYKFSNTSDSKLITSLTNGGVGWLAGMYLSNITSQMEIYKYHPESVMTGVQNNGGAAFYSLQCDTVFQYCVDVEGAGVTDLIAPVYEWNNPEHDGLEGPLLRPDRGDSRLLGAAGGKHLGRALREPCAAARLCAFRFERGGDRHGCGFGHRLRSHPDLRARHESDLLQPAGAIWQRAKLNAGHDRAEHSDVEWGDRKPVELWAGARRPHWRRANHGRDTGEHHQHRLPG